MNKNIEIRLSKGVNTMRLILKLAHKSIILLALLCSACGGANIISSIDAQKVEDAVKEEYIKQVSSRIIEAPSYSISQYKVLGEGSNSNKDTKIYCITVLPEDSLQWTPFVVVKYGETIQVTYPYEKEWIGNGCGDFVTDELAYLGSISTQDKQKIEELVIDEYTSLVSSGRIRSSSYEIEQIKIVGKGNNSRKDVEIFCVVILPTGSNQWKPFMVGRLVEYWEAMYPYESEWNGNGCGGLVDYDLDFY